MTRFVRHAARLAPGALLAAIALVVVPGALAASGVTISGFAFSPSPITVHVGDTVTWTNADRVGHTATADDASFDTGTISSGGTSSAITFSTAGTFAYHCAIHSSMQGTVIVTAATTPPPTDTAAIVPIRPAGTTPWAVLALAAATGLAIARRRFGRPAEGPPGIDLARSTGPSGRRGPSAAAAGPACRRRGSGGTSHEPR